ncbi:MAG: class I SAM-dependent methyltransferase [Candidatus Saccharimonadales bacterium]
MDKITINTYNQLASEYDEETTGFWDDHPREFIDKFTELAFGKKVLDVGSGPGRDGLILREKGLDVTCLDASQAMIDFCSARGLRAVMGDYNSMPFGDRSFDAVWAYTSLLHAKKSAVDIPLIEVSRVLRPNGVIGLGMIEGKGEGYRESAGVNKPRWFSYYTESEIRSLMEKHGFDILFFSKFQPRASNYLNFIARKSSS